MRRVVGRSAIIVVLVMILATFGAQAENAKFEIEVSQWSADLDMTARIDEDEFQGTEFSLDDDIGVDGEEDLTGAQFLLGIGAKRRHKLFLSYGQTDYDGSNVLDDPLIIGDTLYFPGETIRLELDYALARLYYGYSFISRDTVQFGLQAGFYTVITDGTFTASFSEDEHFDVVAPLPVIGLHLQVTPGRRHLVRAIATGVSVEVGDVDGDAFDWEVQYKFMALRWLGIGVGFRAFDLDVEVEEEGLLDLDQDGAFYNVTFRW